MTTRLWPWLLAGVALLAGAREVFTGAVQSGRDLSAHVFPETAFLVSQWARGQVPLWLPNARLGQPFAALLYTQVFYAPRALTGLLFGHVMGPNVLHLLHGGWAFVGLWLAGRRMGLGRAAAFVGAAPFSLSPFFTEFAQNLSFASTAAWAGWTLWAAERLARAPGVQGSARLAVVLGAAFHAGSPEMWLWQAALAALALARAPRALRWGALSFAWAGALAAVVALPAVELAREWTRPGELAPGATEWSVSWAQFLSIAAPGADLPRAGPYWGGADQRFLYTLFIGTSAVALAVLGATARRARVIAALTVGCLVLAAGKHLAVSSALLGLPPFSLFRYPVKYAVGGLFGLSVLAGFGARRLVAWSRRGRLEPATAALGLVLGLALSARGGWAREGFRDAAPWLVVVGALVFLARRRPWRLAAVVAGELVLAPVERWERLPASALARPSRLAPLLREAGRLSIRVDLDDVDHEACGPWDTGPDPRLESRDRLAALRFIEEGLSAVGGYGFREPWRLKEAFSHGDAAFAVAGVNTFVRETWAPAPPGAAQVTPTPIEDVWIWRAARPARRGAFATSVRVAADGAALDAVREGEVVVDHGEPAEGPPCQSEVTTVDLSSVEVEQRLSACAAGAVVLADAWYPGWRVTVDDVEAEPLRAWGFLRAVRVPGGPHVVRWRYAPRSFQLGAALSLAGLAALGLTARRRRTSRPAGPPLG